MIYLRYKISSWNMILISNDFRHNRKIYNFDSYNVLMDIATNMTAFVLQYVIIYSKKYFNLNIIFIMITL